MNDAGEVHYSVRQFGLEDLGLYKAMRLEALQLERSMFGNSYELEASFPYEQWVARITNPAGACFGLYYGDESIGITGIVVTDAALPFEAYMTQSYIRKAFRGKGLSALLYQKRLEWAKDHLIKTLRIGHRESNLASKAANQHFGFVYTHAEARTWPDGQTENMLYYKLEL